MRKSVCCPKCDNRRILYVSEVRDKEARVPKGAVLSIASNAPLWALGAWKNTGVLECCICASCGYTEWYTQAPEAIPVDGQVVRVLEIPEGDGPYR